MISGLVGCGDPPLCQTDVFVAFAQTQIVEDVDAATPGVQTDLTIRTSLQAGEEVELEVHDPVGGTLAAQVAEVGSAGEVVFHDVSVPSPRVVLRAIGRGVCGEGSDQITVDVLAGADCALGLVPAPEPNAFSAPLAVLSTRSDPDPLTPGYQTTVRVVTRPGWTAEVFELAGAERSLATITAGADGIASVPVTVLDGVVGFRATCAGAATERASPATFVVVDTTPPGCALLAPAPGATITPELDANHDLGDGVQLAIIAHGDGGDVAGEPVTLTITDPGGAAIAVPASAIDDAGMTTAAATFAPAETPAQFDVALTIQDHAGNRCTTTASYEVVYDGCAIAVTAPTAPVTADADADPSNGAQLDVTLAVAPACAGRPVTTSCGAATAVVEPDGRAVLRLDACASSPCEATLDCTFQVTTAAGIPTSASAALAFDNQGPSPIADLTAAAADRRRIRLRWTAPDDAGQPIARYVVKTAATAFSEASFDTTGTIIASAAPGAPGTAETLDVVPVRTGARAFFALAAFDALGNRTAIAVAGPITPVFTQTGAILPSNAAQGALAFGAAIAHGKLNDDEFDDLAIAAPTQNAGALGKAGAVYVYFGGPLGIAATPDLTITSGEAGAQLGAGLTVVRRPGATRDDLAIGAPGADAGAGRIFILAGGASFTAGTRAATTAERQLRVSASAPGWFAGGGLGSVLATADVDGDGTADLVASAPRGGGTGGAIIAYGDTFPGAGTVVLSDSDAAAANGAIVELFMDPGATPGRQLGFYLHAVGPTLGALDVTDDLVLAYADAPTAPTASLFLLRGDGTRPAAAGVTPRPFTPGRDVRLDYATAARPAEWASQVATIADQDQDGARDLVISAYRAQNGHGQVVIVSGSILGTAGVARTSDPGVTITTINTAANVTRFGSAIAARDAASHADIDGDGLEDLLIGGETGTTGTGFVWFGGAIPRGTTTTSSAAMIVLAPTTIKFQRQSPQGLAGQARWIGDINHDGLDDLCWASPFDNAGDGSFEVLWDAP